MGNRQRVQLRDIAGISGDSQSRVIMFMGAPGSGKGTQSSMLSSRFGIPCISTGVILREEAKKNTPEGLRLRRIMATGGLVDDATVCQAVVSRIRQLTLESGGLTESVILDGFPRTVAQARRLDQLLESLAMSPVVVHLDVPKEVLMSRLVRRRHCAKCGATYNLLSASSKSGSRCQLDGGALVERDDDSEAVVSRRLHAYDAETLPVLDYYRLRDDRTGVYRRIDGNLPAAEIAKGVCDIVLFADTPLAA